MQGQTSPTQKRAGLRFAAFALSLFCACGEVSSPEVECAGNALLDGEPSAAHRNVFALVHVNDRPSTSGEREVRCTATLIAPSLLVTARHCVAEAPPRALLLCGKSPFGQPFAADALAVTNAMSPRPDEPLRAVAQVVVPAPVNDVCGGDIALLVLAEPVTDVPPVVPALSRRAEPGDAVWALGYGVAELTQPDAPALRRVSQAHQLGCTTATSCGTMMADGELMTDGRMCAGDSGGPLLNADGEIIGVLSRSAAGCEQPVYTSIHGWAELLRETATLAAQMRGDIPPRWATQSSPAATGSCQDW